jgi:hypothetical protein
MMNINGNNTDYWIKWNFILSENFTVGNKPFLPQGLNKKGLF